MTTLTTHPPTSTRGPGSGTSTSRPDGPVRSEAAQERCRLSGTDKRSDAGRMADLFRFPAMNNLGDALDRGKGRKDPRGRRAVYPQLALLATAGCARITGSLASALTALRDPGLWSQCQDSFYSLTKVELPDRPPARHHIEQFREDVTSRPGTLEDLLQTFTAAGCGQARRLGNLSGGVDPDWADPDPRHIIFGDGTIVGRYSDAEIITCPVTGRDVLVNSRATGPGTARIQKDFRHSGADGKNATGINHITLHTRTPYGLVVLGVGTELGAELWTALDLLDAVAREAGDGAHTLVYDGAVTGWAVEYAMARHGIQVLGKVPAASAKKDAHEYTKAELNAYITGVARERGLKAAGRVEKVLRGDILRRMHRGEIPTAVGTSIYPPSKPGGEYDLVYSTYLFTTATHRAPDGTTCDHTLVLDDGALFTTGIDAVSELMVKEEYLPPISSVRHARPGGTWGTTTTFLVPCGREAFTWTKVWEPASTRYDRHSKTTDRSPADPFGWRMRAVPRHDQARFEVIGASRNDSESFNSWFKDTLFKKRAATIDGRGQLLDLLLGGVVKNSDTWSSFRGR